MKKRFLFLVSLLLVLLLTLSACGLTSLPQRLLKAAFPSATATAENEPAVTESEPAVAAESEAGAPAESEPVATPQNAPAVAPANQSAGAIAALEGTLAQVYAQVNPAVVNIQVSKQVMSGIQETPEFPDDMPFDFPMPDVPAQQGLGSGFVWDTEGHIVTNNHVVADATEIRVTFSDGTSVPATLVGADADSDLAVVKVDLPADRLQPVQVADSTQVQVGELVIAIGNPYGLEGTMTVGIVSALGRSLPVESATALGASYTIPDIIQTDAPINPGNSGGVLLDDQGRVIGVTAAIESTSGANAGIGFAIPSAIVERVVPALIAAGRYDHPWVGISGMTLTSDLAEAMDLPAEQRGVLVIEVVSGSPAEEGGLRGGDQEADVSGDQVPLGGDVIIAMDGQPVREFEDLTAYLARYTKVGQQLTLTVLRGGAEETVEITLAARPREETASSQPEEPSIEPEAGAGSGAYLGIVGLTVTPELAELMDLPDDQAGVLVQALDEDGPAERAGVRAGNQEATIDGQQVLTGGDIITALDGQPVATIEALRAALQEYAPGDEVTLALLRGKREIEREVTLGDRPAEPTQ